MITVTPTLLAAATRCDNAHARVFAPFVSEACTLWSIDTLVRAPAFFAQVGHECADFTRLVENLNYSSERLVQLGRENGAGSVWAAAARQAPRLARNPVALANFVYASRLGNGDEESGDGWRYRGRGAIQLTGRRNYSRIGRAVRVWVPTAPDFEAHPEVVSEPRWSVLAAAAFWHLAGCNALADAGKFEALTRAVNGGLVGYKDRVQRWERAKRAFGG